MRRRRESKLEIAFETHATTTDNERWIASGWLDGQLSTLGRRQAKELGDRHADDEDLAAVFGSRGDPARCQCQWSKLRRSEWRAMPREERASRLRAQANCGHPDAAETSGLIAYLVAQEQFIAGLSQGAEK